MTTAFPSQLALPDSWRSFARAIGQIVLQRSAATDALVFLGVLYVRESASCVRPADRHGGGQCHLGHHRVRGFAFIPRRSLRLQRRTRSPPAPSFVTNLQVAAVAIVAEMSTTFIAGKFSRFRLSMFSSPAIIVTWCWLLFFADRGDTGAIPPVSVAGFGTLFEAAFVGLALITFADVCSALGLLLARPSGARGR